MSPWPWRAAGARLLLAGLLVLVAAPAAPGANAGFVTVADGRFVLAGRPFHFVGTNAYYLVPAATWGHTAYTDETMALARTLGFTVLRTWGFFDGPPRPSALQPGPGVYDEAAFRAMDYVLHQADLAGVRLLISLVNRWPDFGGMEQYVQWCQPGAGFEAFYTNGHCRQLYKDYVRHVVTRVNTYNGRRYRDDPTIFAWELANEPEAPDGWDRSGGTVRAWVAEMAAYVKSLDGNHLVGTGEQGYDTTTAGYSLGSYHGQAWLFDGHKGVSFRANTADPHVDFASIHLYPEFWNLSAAAGRAWIADHARIARDLGKPLVIGEFGYRTNTAAVYDQWLRTADAEGVGGALVWQLMCPSCSAMADDFAVVYPPPGGVSEVLRQAAAAASAKSGGAPAGGGGSFSVGPTTASPSVVGRDDGVTVSTRVTAAGAGTATIDLEIHDAAGTRVAQQVYAGQVFAAGQARTFSWTWSGTPTAGVYTVKVGVFRDDWGVLYRWADPAARFEVGAAPQGGGTGGGFTLVGTTVSAGSVRRGQTLELGATVQADAAAGTQVRLEVRDAQGAPVAHSACALAFAAGETRTCAWSWRVPATLPTGPYILAVGVFSSDGDVRHLWVDAASTLRISGGGSGRERTGGAEPNRPRP
jgi:mannan endo-1,4-beta-mannosidase